MVYDADLVLHIALLERIIVRVALLLAQNYCCSTGLGLAGHGTPPNVVVPPCFLPATPVSYVLGRFCRAQVLEVGSGRPRNVEAPMCVFHPPPPRRQVRPSFQSEHLKGLCLALLCHWNCFSRGCSYLVRDPDHPLNIPLTMLCTCMCRIACGAHAVHEPRGGDD